MSVDGKQMQVDTPGQAWSFKQINSVTTRFELRYRDRFCWVEYCDPANAERSELGGWKNVFNPGTQADISYSFNVDPGSPTTSDWLVIGQFHDYAVGSSPPVAIEMHKGDRMAVSIAWLRSQGAPAAAFDVYNTTVEGQAAAYGYVYRDSSPIVRGHTYQISIQIRFGISNGSLVIVRDGIKLVDYRGPLGFGYGNYWRYGIYRSSSPETLGITYGNMRMSP